MRARPWVAVAVAALLASVSGPWASEADCALILQGSGANWREVRAVIETFGGEIHHVLPPDAMVGRIPEAAWDAIRQFPGDVEGAKTWDPDALLLVRTAAEAGAVLSRGGASSGALSLESRAALEFLLPRAPLPAELERTLRVNPDGTVEVLPPEAWETPPLIPENRLPGYAFPEGIGNTRYNTSGYLCGDVAVAICRPESNGGDGSNTENWTGTEVSTTYAELMKAMGQLIADAPRGQLTFLYRTEHVGAGVMGTVDCDYEAVNYNNFDSTVVQNVLGKLGFSSPWGATECIYDWVNAVRANILFGPADWAVGFFIVDDSVAGTGRASAYVNGPAVWIFCTNDYKVYHHESGHSWGGWDEYASAGDSPTMFGGYTQEVNANSEFNDMTGFFSGAGEGTNALMLSNVDYVSPWTRGAMGIWDLDGDGVYEPLDVRPGVNLPNPPLGGPGGPYQFTGVAWGGTLKVESGSFATSDITIGKIGRVEWRMNGGPWDDAFPADGSFDSSWEQFIFSTPPLRNWGYVFEARATDNFGNVTTQYARYDHAETASPLTNQGAYAAASVTPRHGSTGTTFIFDASGSWDLEDGTTGLQYQWDFEGDGIWDAFTPVATHTYPAPGAYAPLIAVVDRMGFGMGRTLPIIQVAPSNIPPVAAFTVDSGLKFVAPAGSPVLFNFDASGSWDCEDAASALQVRWDFEDDGIWDTSWSTNKAVAKDYSWDYAVNPGQESGTSYLYAWNSANGYAQSFVAQTNTVGKAELFLLHFNDLTPGGTVTVGLTAALPGPFLTSVTVNQSSLSEGDLTLFRFPGPPYPMLTIGTMYYLVLISSDTDMMWLASLTNPYPVGHTFFSTNGGVSWGTDTTNCGGTGTGCDHVFRIYDGNLGVVPLTKSKVWRVRMEVKDSMGQAAQYVNHICANGYDKPPFVSLLAGATSGPWNAPFNLTATGSDPDFGTAWDGMVHYRWDTDGDGTYETEFGPAIAYAVMYARSGTYQATCEVRDRYHATAKATVTLSAAPIAGGMGLTDRNGSVLTGKTDEREVDASFAASGEPQEMILSENPAFAGASWRGYAPQVVYKLSSGVGPKTLYAKFRSGAGNESGSVFASINYVPGAPPSLTVTKNGNDARLDWSSVPTGAFDCSVYRSTVADFSSYSEDTQSPTAGTTLDHLGALTDGQTWYYRVETDPLP